MTSVLFSPYRLRNLVTRNRLWVAPMCQYSVDARDGVPTDWHLVHLGSLARGGAGLVLTEATAVLPEGRISPQDTGIWTDEQAEAWARIVRFVHRQGALAGMQLAHAGRKGSTYPALGGPLKGSVPHDSGGWTTVAPSAVPFPGLDAPEELDRDGIDRIVTAFADGARRAMAAGFDLVEVHAAHGYLLHQFLSPLANRRTDEYGGTLENRMRLLIRVVEAVRETVGDRPPILVRLSGTDWIEGGWDAADTVAAARACAQAGADLFDVSSGGIAPAEIPLGPGYQVPLAERVKRETGLPVGAVGLLTEPRQAEAIIAEGRADVVFLARQLLREPHFPLRAAAELHADIDYWPPQYLRARPR